MEYENTDTTAEKPESRLTKVEKEIEAIKKELGL